jgi:N-acyl amino acid synthase of PEP-CTERM/exosortase system
MGKPIASDQERTAGSVPLPGSFPFVMKRLITGGNSRDHHAVYRLRYAVYCHEACFLDPDRYPECMEIDSYDSFSEHFLAADVNNNEVIGTVRLVRWSELLAFPTFGYCRSLLEILQRHEFPLASTAEISRLCIAKQYRGRVVDELPEGEADPEKSGQMRKYTRVILELFKVMYRACRYDLGITHWIATFEDPLYRMLERYGIHFNLLSPDQIDYYGKVRVYGVSLRSVENEMKRRRPDLVPFFED